MSLSVRPRQIFTTTLCAFVLGTTALAASCSKGSGGASTPPAANATQIPPLTFSPDSGASDNVKSECALHTKIPMWVTEYAPGRAVAVQTAPTGGRVLTLQISHILGIGGGAYSGPKQITVDGTLTENGAVIGTFKGRRTTMGGAFAGFKGTCSMLGRCAKALGRDIAQWLEKPAMDARIGEM